MAKIKIRGERSLETKLLRLACDMREDARRVRADHEGSALPYASIASDLDAIAALAGKLVNAFMRS